MKGRWRGSWEEKGRAWAASVGGDSVGDMVPARTPCHLRRPQSPPCRRSLTKQPAVPGPPAGEAGAPATSELLFHRPVSSSGARPSLTPVKTHRPI